MVVEGVGVSPVPGAVSLIVFDALPKQRIFLTFTLIVVAEAGLEPATSGE